MALGEEQANVRETPTAAVYDHLAFTINSDQEAFNTRAWLFFTAMCTDFSRVSWIDRVIHYTCFSPV